MTQNSSLGNRTTNKRVQRTVLFFCFEIYATNAKDTQYSTIMANFACMLVLNSDTEKQAKRTCEENVFQLRIV